MSAGDWRIFPFPPVLYQNCGGGDRWCRHLSSLWGISPSLFVLLPVWCSRSRPTTGVLLAPCHDEFRGSRSDYVRQVALAATQQHFNVQSLRRIFSHTSISVRVLE
ncbi:uncharacterized protein TNCV_2264331 [Trichonephila clavipes]|nr:uncharacterized protein TNCV_2264331 [Trichonephila clavipes]